MDESKAIAAGSGHSKPAESGAWEGGEEVAWLDDYLRRNAAAIAASLIDDQAEFERGDFVTLENVIVELEKRRGSSPHAA
jgi:hypothetical protein